MTICLTYEWLESIVDKYVQLMALITLFIHSKRKFLEQTTHDIKIQNINFIFKKSFFMGEKMKTRAQINCVTLKS